MKCPNWLYRWIDKRGRIPFWIWWIWKYAHFCDEMDYLLIVDNRDDCFCERRLMNRTFFYLADWTPVGTLNYVKHNARLGEIIKIGAYNFTVESIGAVVVAPNGTSYIDIKVKYHGK